MSNSYKNRIILRGWLGILGVVFHIHANTTQVVTNCSGQYVSCENIKVVVMNDATQQVVWKTNLSPVRALKKIQDTQEFVFSTNKGQFKHLISFVPTKGKMVNKSIKVFLVAFDLNAIPNNLPIIVNQELKNMKMQRPDIMSVLQIYKQISGDSWIKIAQIDSAYPQSQTFNQVKFSLTPEAILTFYTLTKDGKQQTNVIDVTEQY